MQDFSAVTPVTTLFDNRYDLDIFKSSYSNIRWGVDVDVVITIDSKYEANLPGLSFDYYGDQNYWRAILSFNGLQDPISDICVGTTIGLPSRSSLDKFMTAKNKTLLTSMTI